MKIVTFNLRCVWDRDDINGFIHRMGLVWDKISREKPDVIGFQEIIPKTLEALQYIMPDYIFVGRRRELKDDSEGLYTAIRKDAIELIGLETFWLGPEPYKPEARFEDQGRSTRICVMTELREISTGTIFRLYNVHLDHKIENARLEGIQCVWEQMQLNNAKRYLPSIVLGDFNAEADDKSVLFCKDAKRLYDVTEKIPYTYHNFGKGDNGRPGSKIDYIFVTEEFSDKAVNTTAWEDMMHGIYLSDHYPVSVEISV